MKKYIIASLVFAFLITGCSQKKEESNSVFVSENNVAEYMSLNNKGAGWGFKKEKGREPEIDIKTKELFRKYNTFYIDENRGKSIYLTFDEGYENGHTAQILDVLKKCNVPAAFFVTGAYIEREEELVRRMLDEGHIVGNHTVNHPNLPKLENSADMAKELTELNKKFENHFNAEMKYMRPPEGEYSERLLAVASSLGYKTIFWSFAYKDWDPKLQKGAEYAYKEITPYLHDGAILLLHAVSGDNAGALENVINYAKEQGYEFKSLDELTTH